MSFASSSKSATSSLSSTRPSTTREPPSSLSAPLFEASVAASDDAAAGTIAVDAGAIEGG